MGRQWRWRCGGGGGGRRQLRGRHPGISKLAPMFSLMFTLLLEMKLESDRLAALAAEAKDDGSRRH